jgi:cytochrome c-type protein NapC
MPGPFVLILSAAAALLALLLALRPSLTRSREGKILAFVAIFLAPTAVGALNFAEHMQRAQSRTFCLSCHVMEDYGRSLHIDDPSFLPARHFQNHLIPTDQACYACHTQYTMFGTVAAKIKGVRHLWVQYFGTVPQPAEIKLYEPFNNRECLHCHLGQRRFEEASPHQRAPELLGNIKSGKTSCVSSGCHEFIHGVADLKDATFWKEPR